MECPKCGTWNPDDKAKCWRCSAELPLPPKPRKSRKIPSQTWLWVVAVLFSLLTFLAQCGFLGGDGDRGTGYMPAPALPWPVVRLESRERVDGPMALARGDPLLASGAVCTRSL
jgi:hypothetical protein